MLACRDLVNKAGIVEGFLPARGGLEIVQHRLRLDSGFGSEIDHRVRLRFENVIAFILGIVHPKLLLDVLGDGMNLEAQVLAADSVEKIKADGKFSAKPGVNLLTQQRARVK